MNYRDCGAFCLLAALAVGCQPEEGPALMWEQYDAPNGVERHTGSGCADVNMTMGSSTGVAGGGNLAESVPPHSLDFVGDGTSVTVTIKDASGQVLDTGRYPEKALVARVEDELRADFPNGDYLRLKVWGRAVCEELRSPPAD